MSEEKTDSFKPELLIGKKLSFRCEYCETPTEFEILAIVRHHKCITMGWTYKGRADLVIYETTVGEHTLEYREVNDLIEFGTIDKKRHAYDLKIIN
jgi:hypothetical protein